MNLQSHHNLSDTCTSEPATTTDVIELSLSIMLNIHDNYIKSRKYHTYSLYERAPSSHIRHWKKWQLNNLTVVRWLKVAQGYKTFRKVNQTSKRFKDLTHSWKKMKGFISLSSFLLSLFSSYHDRKPTFSSLLISTSKHQGKSTSLKQFLSHAILKLQAFSHQALTLFSVFKCKHSSKMPSTSWDPSSKIVVSILLFL